MKTRFIPLVIIIMAFIDTDAQQNNKTSSKIPKLVIEAFEERYPDIQEKKWKRKKETFVAKFSSNRKKYKATFNFDGKWVQTETSIKWKELPSNVRKTYNMSEFIWLIRTSVEELQTAEYGHVYLIEGDNMNKESDPICTFKLYFTEDGVIVKKETDCKL